MITLENLKNNDIAYNWATIYVGLHYKLFSNTILNDYATEIMIDGDDSTLVNDLVWGVSDADVPQYLQAIKEKYLLNLEEGSSEWGYELRKLRYMGLLKIKKNSSTAKELLDKVALLYDDIGYPADMNSFINYMPQESTFSVETLLQNLDIFLKNEKKYIYGE